MFVNSKLGCARLARSLEREGINTTALHGDKSQDERLKALDAFKEGEVDLLVATDVAARGLDIKDVPAVFNFDVPFNAEDYVHRIGRTGRAGASGLAVTLRVAASDTRLVADIEKLLKRKIELEAIEFDEDKPRGRINDGRRAWREAGEVGDPRDVLDAPRERERAPRPQREYRAAGGAARSVLRPALPGPATEARPHGKPASSRASPRVSSQHQDQAQGGGAVQVGVPCHPGLDRAAAGSVRSARPVALPDYLAPAPARTSPGTVAVRQPQRAQAAAPDAAGVQRNDVGPLQETQRRPVPERDGRAGRLAARHVEPGQVTRRGVVQAA